MFLSLFKKTANTIYYTGITAVNIIRYDVILRMVNPPIPSVPYLFIFLNICVYK